MLLARVLAPCVSQERTSRPENLTFAAGKFAVPNVVVFVILVLRVNFQRCSFRNMFMVLPAYVAIITASSASKEPTAQ
jgi:hypothetical protein